ncbi:hypothetical protein [Sorangium sp. So ce1151]|uniref:hypothetical protein n=1 Tax=Sorangium sp. So ce1151 TaxID=3133332 RepID=UPI003F626F0E
MLFRVHGVTVTNWDKDPLLDLRHGDRSKLGLGVVYAREIVSDAVDLIGDYLAWRPLESVDADSANRALHFPRLFPGKNVAPINHAVTVMEALGRYFDLDHSSPTFEQDVRTIWQKLRLLRAGIGGAFEIVVGHRLLPGEAMRAARGSATALLTGAGHARLACDHMRWIRTGAAGSAGPRARIHIGKHAIQTFTAGDLAVNILHEASHRFASTIDVAYRWEGLSNDTGGFTGLTNDADSHAWASRRIWQARRGHPAHI